MIPELSLLRLEHRTAEFTKLRTRLGYACDVLTYGRVRCRAVESDPPWLSTPGRRADHARRNGSSPAIAFLSANHPTP